MIEGIKVEMTTAQLDEHLQARIAHHKGRVQWYEKTLAELQGEEVEEPAHSNTRKMDTRSHLQRHQDRVGYFTVVSKYLIPNEKYRLSDSDLHTLEFVKHSY